MKTAHSLLATAIAAGLMFSTGAQARNKLDTPEINKSGFVFTLGYYQGGEKSGDIGADSNGENGIRTRHGNGILATIGYRFALDNSPMSLQLNAGLFNHYDSTDTDDGEEKVYLKRETIELIPFYNFDKQQRIGIGALYHISPEGYWKNNSGASYKWEADDALGLIVQYDYQLTQYFMVGARFQAVEYEYPNGKDRNASGFGINLGMSY